MVKILQAVYRNAGKELKAGRIEQYLSDINMMPALPGYLARIYKEVGVFYAAKTLREINASAREQKALEDEWLARIIEYLQTQLLNKAVLPIRLTTVEDIRAIMDKGTTEGWGVDRMVYELDHTELSVQRARVIVRTESLKAQFEGKRQGAESSDYEVNKTWIAANDHRTRNSHRAVNDKVIRQDERFAVPKRKGGYDMMLAPGDPDASAENVIQCRCTVSYRAARDENGRLIRKRKISVILPEQVRQRRPTTVVTV